MKQRLTGSIFAIATLAILALIPKLSYAGDPAKGQEAAMMCAGCHGVTGIAVAPNYPNLAGQKEAYLVKAIQDYRSGARNDPVMKAMAAALAEENIEDVAAYFSSQAAK